MFIYPLQQHKNIQTGLFPKFPVLHLYIPSTTTQTYVLPRFPEFRVIYIYREIERDRER